MAAASDDDTTLYTRSSLLAILSSYKATPSDYLLRTYFQINRITEGPLHSKYERRFNNIIFNNFSRISKELTRTVFFKKARQILRSDLNQIEYISCICSTTGRISYIFVQFFTPDQGLQHRILEYVDKAALATTLNSYDIMNKVVGYCGDYCYRDPANTRSRSDHVATLRMLSGRDVMQFPYSDGFIQMLFDVLLDYLPEDVTKGLEKLGETMMRMSSDSDCMVELIKRYKEWSRSEEHILGSDYAEYVIQHFNTISSYLEPFECLPYSVGNLFSSLLHRFLLVFMRDVYLEVDSIRLTDNNAIVYYYYLKSIKDMFETYENNNHIPSKAFNFYNSEIDYLLLNKQLDSEDSKIDKLLREILVTTNQTYARGVKYVEPFLRRLKHLETFSWILLNDLPIKLEQIYESYLCVTGDNGDRRDLAEEIKVVNSVISRVPLLEIESVVSKWMVILKEGELPKFGKMVEYFLSFPSSCKVMNEEETKTEFEDIEKFVRCNLKGVKGEEMERTEEFFEEYLEETEEIVKEAKIPLLRD